MNLPQESPANRGVDHIPPPLDSCTRRQSTSRTAIPAVAGPCVFSCPFWQRLRTYRRSTRQSLRWEDSWRDDVAGTHFPMKHDTALRA